MKKHGSKSRSHQQTHTRRSAKPGVMKSRRSHSATEEIASKEEKSFSGTDAEQQADMTEPQIETRGEPESDELENK